MIAIDTILNKMADQVGGLMSLGIFGMDGIPIIERNPGGLDMESLAAKFAMIMQVVAQTSHEFTELGEMEDNLVVIQLNKARMLTRLVNNDCFLIVVVNRSASLATVRTTLKKYHTQMIDSL